MAPNRDPAKEGLLREHEISQQRASLGSEDDLDLDELNTALDDDDPLKASSARDSSRLSRARQRLGVPGRLSWMLPRRMRKSRCCITVLVVIAIVILLLAAGGTFGYKKLKLAPLDGKSPPWYPTPKGGTVRQWADSYKKAAEMVSKMTLPEKVNITTGTGWSMGLAVGNTAPAIHVGFPALALQDGPLGVRFAHNITAFPAGVTVGATWNRELMYERGKAHALEARGKGINVLLGPAIGPLGRMPAGGRNWEGFGADPYLQGIAGSQTIKGIQDQGVMATIKHFIANEQEHFRQAWEWVLPNALSSNIDDRTLHEIYAWPFGDAVKAGVASVMCSYNMINNSYACGNSKLLNGILKDELGFQGFVMSDWLAQRSGVGSALAGLDMSMPGDGLRWQDGNSLWGPNLSRAVLNGSLPLERLNDMVVRIVAAWYQLGQDDTSLFDRKGPNFSSWTKDKMGFISPASPSPQEKVQVNKFVNVQANHSILARQVAIEGTVLLRNDGVLPLSVDGNLSDNSLKQTKLNGKVRIGIFGEDAGPGNGPNYCEDRSCNQGTLGSGWGSGAVEFPYLIPPVEALQAKFNNETVKVVKHLQNDKLSKDLLKTLDICMVFINSDSGEGYRSSEGVYADRNDLKAQKGGEQLVTEVAKNCGEGSGTTIVVIHSVGPVTVDPWIDIPSIKALISANLPSQESGNALASIIFGEESPSGKLPYTIGKSLSDYGEGGQVMYLPNGAVPQQDFNEGLYIDYRHFDKYNIEPRYEFGFGLSYTTFDYKNLEITGNKPTSSLPHERPTPEIEPPQFDTAIPKAEEALYPSGIRKLKLYIYPYIDSVDDIKEGKYPYPEGYDVKQPPSGAGGGEGGNPSLWESLVTISVDVTNTGNFDGKAVPQLYLSYPKSDTIDFPVRVLRGFDKLLIEKGATKTVEFALTRRDLSYWDVEKQNWVIPDGEFTFAVGESSRDLRATGTW
ncbi:beta-glucosidase e [Trichoderma arundinaceum]|uniref:beta-glucosidase n=1 Tax=Trichoderma arundinaceum TaxID=490622 RepID=A0A395NXI7_TRIAR|nr:beta-glucosidase e [Trichoderma arundinaceum]